MQHQIKRGAAGELETFAMANCLMLLSSQNAAAAAAAAAAGGGNGAAALDQGRMFSCKTCGRKFSSFQALGGHRASHKKVKLAFPDETSIDAKSSSPPKPKTHACSICGVEFPIGQALGGHMRRHRPILPSGGSTVTTEHSAEHSDGNDTNSEKKRKIDAVVVPVLKKSSSSKRVCLDLNLNLSSWNEKDHREIEEGEIVEQKQEEERDFLKLELRQPMNWSVSY